MGTRKHCPFFLLVRYMGDTNNAQGRILFMKKKEIVTLALTTALLMTAHAVPASAASNAPESMSQTGSIQTITPRWESTNVVVPSISISGKQISVSVYISPKKSTTSSVGTLYLEKKVGNGWTPVTSWSIDGTGSVSITKTYTGTMGITYRTRVVVTTGVDKIDATSTERTVLKNLEKDCPFFLCLSVIQVNPQNRR